MPRIVPVSEKITLASVVVLVAVALIMIGWGLGWFPQAKSSGPSKASPDYAVDFSEEGLPNGTIWSVTLGGQTMQDPAPTPIAFSVSSGAYSYLVGSVPGYSDDPSAGSLSVGTSPLSVVVNFTPVNQSIQHVVVIMMENIGLSTAVTYAPYLDYLWNTYGHATQFYAVCHDSTPDYTSIVDGRYYVCGGTIPTSASENLPDVLQAHSMNWGGYFESMPTACDPHPDGQIYDPSHNPFLISEDIIGNTSRCDAHVVNSSVFNASVASGSLPAFSLYAPNTDDDCEYTTLPVCDTWLKGFLSPMLNSTSPPVKELMQHTAFFIVFDEGLNYAGYSVGGIVNGYCQNETGTALTVCGGNTYLAVVSPYSHGTSYISNATDYNIESTIEWLLGVGSDGGYDGTANFPAMTSLFA
jgi:hypothetical protein